MALKLLEQAESLAKYSALSFVWLW